MTKNTDIGFSSRRKFPYRLYSDCTGIPWFHSGLRRDAHLIWWTHSKQVVSETSIVFINSVHFSAANNMTRHLVKTHHHHVCDTDGYYVLPVG